MMLELDKNTIPVNLVFTDEKEKLSIVSIYFFFSSTFRWLNVIDDWRVGWKTTTSNIDAVKTESETTENAR